MLCVQSWRGERIRRVYSRCGARVYEMIQWLDDVQGSIGNRLWVLIGD